MASTIQTAQPRQTSTWAPLFRLSLVRSRHVLLHERRGYFTRLRRERLLSVPFAVPARGMGRPRWGSDVARLNSSLVQHSTSTIMIVWVKRLRWR
eukprot:COSAG02_NODE_305_length_25176_cov_30.787455_20_plen_95_part_00